MPPLVIFVLAFPIVVAALLTCDELVELEHDLTPERWAADGMPAPMLRRSAAIPFTLPAMFASTRCCLAWIVSTPEWAYSDPKAARLLRRVRLLLVIWTFVAVPMFVLTSFLSLKPS
jgi:hypothetical protein